MLAMRRTPRHTPGFTIVELLIVIVVIGVLAAITIVAFNGIQQRARVATVKADLASAAKQLELTNLNDGAYPADTSSLKASAGTTYQYAYTASTNTYCLTATNGTSTYNVSSTASTPTEGGCAGHGVGGVAAVTNMATDPSFTTTARMSGTGGPVNSIVTGGAYHGTTFGRRTFSASAASAGLYYNPILNASAGKTYSASIMVRTSVARSMRMSLDWKDSGGAHISGTAGTVVSVGPSGWTMVTVTGTAPANTGRILVNTYTSTAVAAGETHDFDAIIVTETDSPQAYADGNSPNWIWNGPENNATSTGPPV